MKSLNSMRIEENILAKLTKKIREHRLNDDGDYDIIHRETSGDLVVLNDGTTAQERINALGDELSDVSKLLDETVNEIRNEIRDEISGINDSIGGINTTITGIEDNINGIKGNITGIEGNISEVRSDIGGIKGDVSGIHSELEGIREQIAVAGNASDSLVATYSQTLTQKVTVISVDWAFRAASRHGILGIVLDELDGMDSEGLREAETLTAVAASSTAMTAVARNSTSRTAISNHATARNVLAGSALRVRFTRTQANGWRDDTVFNGFGWVIHDTHGNTTSGATVNPVIDGTSLPAIGGTTTNRRDVWFLSSLGMRSWGQNTWIEYIPC